MAGDGGAVDRGSDLELALAHELAHLQRRDLVWGVVPWAARLAFFFHPLAPLALREYLLAREAACDAAVLETRQASDAARPAVDDILDRALASGKADKLPR